MKTKSNQKKKIFIKISSAGGEERGPLLKLKISYSLEINYVLRMESSREIMM